MNAVCSFIRGCFKKNIPRLTADADSRWQERNKAGRCGSCNTEFTPHNPDSGGGQCRKVMYTHILHFFANLRAYENYAQINKRRKIKMD